MANILFQPQCVNLICDDEYDCPSGSAAVLKDIMLTNPYGDFIAG